jgi:hypothetical protein
MQDRLPSGATIVGIIAASDKTHVTTGTGGLHMHPLFITISNISADVRQKATAHAWSCAAFIPIPKFNVHPDFQSILHARVWHRCLDIVTASLKTTARVGKYSPDPFGQVRNMYTPLVAYTADLPEQLLISCVASSGSPVSIATTKQFGDVQPYPSRHGSATLRVINDLCKAIDPWDIPVFQAAAKAIGLNGVHFPFWRDWNLSDPSLFLVPEILHTCHKFFFDHVLLWCKVAVGRTELDRRFKSLHKRIGYRHFGGGISHVKQMTSREHRDIQRTIVAVIAGAAPPQFIRAIRAIVDFIYLAQSPRHTTTSLWAMAQALQEFHDEKSIILEVGARRGKKGAMDHFNIPKLELLQNFERAIKMMGAIMQYTADVSERLLITHCKHTFKGTNHVNFWEEQCVRILDRQEKVRLFDLYSLLRSNGASLINETIEAEESFMSDVMSDCHPETAWVSRVLPGEETRMGGPRLQRNLFASRGVISIRVFQSSPT